MNRIMIIGCCGSGKSTLARKLHEKSKLPIIHLDQHYHLPNWTEPTPEDWATKVRDLAAKNKWIMDGNYGGTMDMRMARADLVIYLKYSTLECLKRVIQRTWKYHGQVRPDMPKGCKERFNLEFLHYVASYNMTRGKVLLKRLAGFKGKSVVLRSDKQVSAFVNDFVLT